MKIINALSLGLCLAALVSSCGGGESANESTPATSAPVTTEAPAAAPAQAPNPHLLSTQQQLMKDAAAVQKKLDEDAEAKKKALQNLN